MWMLHNAYHEYLIKCQKYKLLMMNTLKLQGVFQSQCREGNPVCNCACIISTVIEPDVQRTDDQASSLFKCVQCSSLHKAVIPFKLKRLCSLWPQHWSFFSIP